MKTTQNQITSLTQDEMASTKGGFIFFIPLLVPLIVNSVAGAVLLSPFAGSVIKGWNEYK